MKTIWLNDWQDADKADLEKLFALKSGALADIELLLASYKQGDDSGYGFIFFRLNQQFFEVNVSHDSERDLQGQWEPEDTSIEALLFRLHRGNLGSSKASENIFDDALKNLLKSLMQ